MTEMGDLSKGIRSENIDACEKALADNWTAIMVAAALEITQWGVDLLTLVQFWGSVPVIGPILKDAFYVDWTRTYAYGVLGDAAMATTNMKCAANTYADISKNFEPDYVFEQDNDFYLQSIGASQ